ncbi:hypothetical protein TCSYLVIO_007755 [Trypanosoma cruzi]|nr:hypothetical protein TCSYLVIO_007755 [Trypanosoma cruzi]
MTTGTASVTEWLHHMTIPMRRRHTGAEAGHVAALRPPVIKRVRKVLALVVRKWSGELAGRQQTMRRFSFTRVSALHNKQRHHMRTALHKEGMKEHGGRTQSQKTRAQTNCTVRLAHKSGWWLRRCHAVRVACDCSGRRGRREGKEMRCGPHPSRLTVTPVTSSRQIACNKDRRRQQRSAPSLSHWSATPPTPSLFPPSPTQRGSNSGKCDNRDEHAAAESHCSRHDQTKKDCTEHSIQILGHHTFYKKGGRETCRYNRQFHSCLWLENNTTTRQQPIAQQCGQEHTHKSSRRYRCMHKEDEVFHIGRVPPRA